MKFKKGNIEKEATNAFEIAQLKAIGFKEVKEKPAEKASAPRTAVTADIADQLAKKEAENDPNPSGSTESKS